MDPNQDASAAGAAQIGSPEEELEPGADGPAEFLGANPEMDWMTMEEAGQEPDQGQFPSLFPDLPPLTDPSIMSNTGGGALDGWLQDQSAFGGAAEQTGDSPFEYFPDAQFEEANTVEEAGESENPLPSVAESSAGSSSKPPETKSKGKSRSRPKKLTTESPTTPRSPTTTSSSSSKNRQLRTAVRKPAVAGSSRQVAATPPAQGGGEVAAQRRRTHNTVEKRYRGRLNEQFEGLLAALPSKSDNPTSPTSATGGDDKRLSKGAVLDLAQKRIQELQDEHAELMAEREILQREEENILRRAGWTFNQEQGDSAEHGASDPS